MSYPNQNSLQQQHQQQAPPAAAGESPQPVVRVMRLYKPGMHVSAPVPQLRMPEDINREVNVHTETDFALSNFILLPDSFGDIYLGEKFSAYVSVVNGTTGAVFSPVQLSVKLQSTITSYDLIDDSSAPGENPGRVNLLGPSEMMDVVVGHPINAIGTHSLKVFVEYVDPESGEQKTLKKFYKFTALNPLLVSSTAMDLGNKYIVQCQITNCTRSTLHIETVSLLSHRDLRVVKPSSDIDVNDVSRFDSFSSLGPDEKYAQGFILEKPAGFMVPTIGSIEVKWSTAMGEHGFVRGEELTAPASRPGISSPDQGETAAPVENNPRNIYRVLSPPSRLASVNSSSDSSVNCVKSPSISFHCLSCPDTALSGQEFEIKLRLFNDNYSNSATIHVRCSNPCHSGEGSLGLLIVGKTSWNVGLVRPREFVDISVHAVAMSSGLHEFGGVYITDVIGGREYCSEAAIANVFIKSQ